VQLVQQRGNNWQTKRQKRKAKEEARANSKTIAQVKLYCSSFK